MAPATEAAAGKERAPPAELEVAAEAREAAGGQGAVAAPAEEPAPVGRVPVARVAASAVLVSASVWAVSASAAWVGARDVRPGAQGATASRPEAQLRVER